MSEDLFKPSLTNSEYCETKTYDISKLFFVAFFGGVIPTMGLGTINCKWLNIKKHWIVVMIILGLIFLSAKMVAVRLLFLGALDISNSVIRWGYKVLSLILFAGYYLLQKSKFKMHTMFGGQHQPILKDAIKWIIWGIVIEAILIMFAGGFMNAE